eukprot:10987883-Ditylum_brightwellii.AAC.1
MLAHFLCHLYDNCRQITSTMISESENNMSKAFNPAAPIKYLFKQINNGQDLVIAAEIPYSDI